jgi:uncharacterized membrane protein YdfJ with MMPL/SSD domain
LLRHFDENSPTPQVEPEAFATKFANLHAALVLTGDFKISRLTSIGFQIRSVGETDTRLPQLRLESAASFGLSVLIWQDVFGIKIHWLVMLLSVITLMAVGSDYNLLLVSRIRDDIHAGLKTGMIRSMAGTGGVVTSAGLVFAVTMASMLGSSLLIIAQLGSTIAIGLLLDTLIVCSLLMPSIATLLGRWFWWPQVVYPRRRP